MMIKSNRYNLLPISSTSRMKIGILGGTFNPAHEGHRYISIEAIKRFGLDLVIWFVTPQNPLKNKGLANTLEKRLLSAKTAARHPKILVTDYEAHLENNYTISLLKRLKLMYKNVDFCYIIGADNMRQLPRWYKWKEILNSMPLIIFDREEHHRHLISSKMKACFSGGRIGPIHKSALSQRKWYFVKLRKNPKSSTQIRYEQNYQ